MLDKGVSKEETADVVLDFLNEKRVKGLSDLLDKRLCENSENCNVLEGKIVDSNIEASQ